MRLPLVGVNTCTLSIRHSPVPPSSTCNWSTATFPLVIIPLTDIVLQGALCVSSLAAQFDGNLPLLCGSIRSRLLPPPWASSGQRPPPACVTSSITICRKFVVITPTPFVLVVVSGLRRVSRSPPPLSFPLKSPSVFSE